MKKYEHLVLKFDVPAQRGSPDADKLVSELQSALSQKQSEGWAAISSSEILRGEDMSGGSVHYAFSTTAAIIVILRRELPA